MDLLGGSASVHLGSVGYCSQDPWLRTNSSIKDNITFMHPYDLGWYTTVIKAVGLDVDMRTVAEGDECLVSNLSGGQKQRYVSTYGRSGLT